MGMLQCVYPAARAMAYCTTPTVVRKLERSLMTAPDPNFDQGLQTIQIALETEFARRRVRVGAISQVASQSDPPDAVFRITANGVSQDMRFTRDEIISSAQNIRASAADKVRTLGGFFASIDDTQ